MEFLKKLEGKKTHLLVLAAILLMLFKGGESVGGFSVANVDAGELSQALLVAAISTFKAGIERALKK